MPELPNYISSADNPRIKLLRKLQRKKYRDELALFVVENPLTVRDGLKFKVPQELFITPSFIEKYSSVYRNLEKSVPPEKIFTVEEKIFSKSVSLEQPQGMAAVYAKADEKTDLSKSVVFLSGVADPGNVGAIMRSGAAFGIASVVADQASADLHNPKTVSAAKESIFSVSLARQQPVFLAEIKNNMQVYALDVHGGRPLNEVKWSVPFCLVLGSEAHGISDNLRTYINTFITITMDTGRVESLNVAASGAIALHKAFLSLR